MADIAIEIPTTHAAPRAGAIRKRLPLVLVGAVACG